MALNFYVHKAYHPLWHPSTTADGKFYDAMVVEMTGQDGNGNNVGAYVAVFNHGKGRADDFLTGAIDLGVMRGTLSGAQSDAVAKLSAKRKGGYSDDPLRTPFPSAVPTGKVQAKLSGVASGSAAFNPPQQPVPTPVAPDSSEPRKATPRRKAGELVLNASVVEKKAAGILTLTNTEAALKALQVLKKDVETIRTDADNAESAFEMATLYVQSRLQ
jgi:hypothetical protein